jgi:small GTP-binding protein
VEPIPAAKTLRSKVCLIGDAAVGKTSLVRRFVRDEFSDAYLTTLGTKVSKKSVDLPPGPVPEPVHVDMAIWDIMGQPGFLNLLREAYFTGASAVFAIVDPTRRDTLDHLDAWVRNVWQVAGRVPVVIAVNKSDLTEVRVSLAEVQAIAPAYAATVLPTSAKTGANVEAAFRQVAERAARYQLQIA